MTPNSIPVPHLYILAPSRSPLQAPQEACLAPELRKLLLPPFLLAAGMETFVESAHTDDSSQVRTLTLALTGTQARDPDPGASPSQVRLGPRPRLLPLLSLPTRFPRLSPGPSDCSTTREVTSTLSPFVVLPHCLLPFIVYFPFPLPVSISGCVVCSGLHGVES